MFESKISIKFASNNLDPDFFKAGDDKFFLEGKIDHDTPVVIAEFNSNDSITSEDSEYKHLTMLYSSDFIFFNIRKHRKIEAMAKIDLK